jgi:hypothetical protein
MRCLHRLKYNLNPMNPARICTVLLILLLASACSRPEVPPGTPPCVRSLIRSLERRHISPPASVWRWEIEGESYYYVPPQCCDMPSELYDSDCNRICAPDGGITGQGDGRCPEGLIDSLDASSVTVIWTAPR